MKAEDFFRMLREQHGYQTPPDRRGTPFLRRFDSWYYLQVFAVIIRSSRLAKQGRFDRMTWAENAHAMMNAMESCGARVDISGLGHIAGLDRAAVVISNHMSTLETYLLPGAILPFRWVSTVVKESLLNYPFFGNVMRSIAPISVQRKNPRQDLEAVLTQGAQRLADGRCVVVFPQSTRAARFSPDDFNTLGIKLARRNNAPVVPAAVKTDFQDNGKRFKDFGRLHRDRTVHVRFGAPMAVTGAGKDQHQAVIRFITDCLAEWTAADASTPQKG